MPTKMYYNGNKVATKKVSRAEYLQVILFFLEECHNEEEYINLP